MTLNASPYGRTLTCVMPVLFTFNLQTKFEMSSFFCSKDMAWAQKGRKEPHDPEPIHLGDSQASQD